jgi:uncharacterized membrane protein
VSRFRFKISAVEIFVIAVLLVFGSAACIGLPVLSGFDEDQHLLRAWEMSTFHFLPNEMLSTGKAPFPAIYFDLANRALPYGIKIERDFWTKNIRLPIDAHGYLEGDISTRSAYSPLLLLPQSLVMRFLGRNLSLPALIVFYAMRLIGLLCYLFLAWLAVRVTPFGKWVIAILSVAPMALFEAATINVDTLSNGLALVFIASSLAIAYQERVRWKEWGVLVLLFFLLFSTKVNFIFLAILPFLILPASRFKMKGGLALLVLAVVFLFAFEFVGWNLISISHTTNPFPGADPVGQLKHIAAHPFEFGRIVITDFWQNLKPYARQWFGVYGYGYWAVPLATYVFFALAMAVALVQQSPNREPARKIRWSLGVVFILGYVATIGAMYLSYTPAGSSEVLGVQGRYFIPVVPCLLLALSGLARIKITPFLTWPAMAVLTAASLAFFTFGFLFSYYVTCGNMYYQTGLCYRPVYKKWSPSTVDTLFLPPLGEETSLSQTLIPECNGMSELRVWLDASRASINGVTEFNLEDLAHQTLLEQQSITDNRLPAGGWHTLKFAPDWSSAGKTYQLTINSKRLSGGIGIEVAYYDATSISTIGEARLNAQLINGAILYQYGCISGLEKVRWLISNR